MMEEIQNIGRGIEVYPDIVMDCLGNRLGITQVLRVFDF